MDLGTINLILIQISHQLKEMLKILLSPYSRTQLVIGMTTNLVVTECHSCSVYKCPLNLIVNILQ